MKSSCMPCSSARRSAAALAAPSRQARPLTARACWDGTSVLASLGARPKDRTQPSCRTTAASKACKAEQTGDERVRALQRQVVRRRLRHGQQEECVRQVRFVEGRCSHRGGRNPGSICDSARRSARRSAPARSPSSTAPTPENAVWQVRLEAREGTARKDGLGRRSGRPWPPPVDHPGAAVDGARRLRRSVHVLSHRAQLWRELAVGEPALPARRVTQPVATRVSLTEGSLSATTSAASTHRGQNWAPALSRSSSSALSSVRLGR